MGRLFYAKKNIKLEEQHLVEQYKDKSELPKHIRLDACTFCQLKCRSCYMHQDKEAVEQGCKFGYLNFENFKKLVDDNDIESIEFSNNGEIFLNPDLVKIIEYAYKKNIIMTANNGVNLNYLTDEQAEALTRYRFESIAISIDGASQETYGEYRVGGDFNKVVENIKKINYYKSLYKNGEPYLVWKFVVFGYNEHEIEKAKQLSQELGVNAIKFYANWDPDYSPVKNPEKVLQETGLYSLDVNTSPIEQLKEYEEGIVDWYFCRDLWEPQINWDGQVLGCCANYKENFGGNAFKEGLLGALNHPNMIYAKNMVTNNAKPAKDIPCCRCWVYKDMYKNNVWIKSPKVEGTL